MVATKVGDIPEIIEHRQNGLAVEPGDPEALASAILEFFGDPKMAALCAANGLQHAREHFSFDRMMERKLRVDASLCRRRVAEPLPSPLSPVAAAELVSHD